MWLAGIALGLLSSAHCVGMCGPLHLALAARQRPGKFLIGRLVFNLGRIGTYGFLGLCAGMVGGLGRMAVSQQVVSIAAGLAMLLVAAAQLIGMRNSGTASAYVAGIKAYFFKWMDRKSLIGQAITGAINALLPCGTVYLALAGSLAMTSVSSSALFMLAFGAGTFPLLFSISFAGKSLLALTRALPQVQYVLPVFIGGLLIIRGVAPMIQNGDDCHQHHVETSLNRPVPGNDRVCIPHTTTPSSQTDK